MSCTREQREARWRFEMFEPPTNPLILQKMLSQGCFTCPALGGPWPGWGGSPCSSAGPGNSCCKSLPVSGLERIKVQRYPSRAAVKLQKKNHESGSLPCPPSLLPNYPNTLEIG